MKFPSNFRSLKKLFFPSSVQLRGFIEVISMDMVRGWVFHPEGAAPITLRIQIGDEVFDLQPHWAERQDVASVHGEKALNSGFTCKLDSSHGGLAEAIDGDIPILVSANNQTISMIGEARKTGTRLKWDKLDINIFNEGMHSSIEAWGGFGIRGWVSISEAASPSLSITVSGNEFPLDVVWSERKEIARNFGLASSLIGFEIDLPGYLWGKVDPDSELEFNLVADGQLLTPDPLTLSHTLARQWIEELKDLPDNKERQYRTLLALEHIRFGSLMEGLATDTQHWLLEYAERMRLVQFVPVNKTESIRLPEVPESFSTLLLWKALKMLNTRISDQKQFTFEHVLAILDELKLHGEVREQFLASSIPLLCRTNGFLRLREISNFDWLQKLGNEDGNLYNMTLSLPAIVSEGDVGRATRVIYRSIQLIESGWLNTECIRFSLQLVLQAEADGEIEMLVAEKFRYAVIVLLDSFKGEWFSRLHDHCLVDSMLLILSEMERYTDYHRRDVISAALRIYGLNPTFWERGEIQNPSNLDSELARAHSHFRKIHQAFIAKRGSLANWLEEVAEPLAYFRSKNNPESLIFLREICANTLPELNVSLPIRAKALLSKLLASDPAEALRIAAFPLSKENQLLGNFPETTPEILRETIRRLSDPTKSVAWHLQENASKALKRLLTAHSTSNHSEIIPALDALEKRAITLANWQGDFLAFDLLSSGYAISITHQLECSPLVSRLFGILLKAVEETKTDWHLPQPIFAGLNRLNNLDCTDDPILRDFLLECQTLINTKFSGRKNELQAPSENLQIRLAESGWPQDTLVVIYSCRKYLETRIKEIRKTWVQDLKVRGIPYVVLVGDGNDSLEGDVLALDVSDLYEDLPKKSLKLFDWIYKNTNAQYVLKIDDDCHLDVARYFDTLSYRKHFYYGRIIKCGIGGMDREWHQSKSHTEHGRNTIDKSPEPSTYADGGGGYTLSRLALLKLQEAAQSPQGERLIAASFMEDKLIGDLLAINHIGPSNEDYDSYQRRRTFGDAMPVGKVENTFFPCQSSPTKVTHLDNHHDLAPTRAKANSKELWPKKIWQTCCSPNIKSNSNQLELLTSTETTAELLKNEFLVISVVRNEITLLPHFISHYRKLGVKCFAIVDNCSDDGTREYLYKQPDVVLYSSDTEYKHSHYGVAWQQAILGNHCLGKWVLLADADELLVYEGCESKNLETLVNEIEHEGCNAATTFMVDMYPFDDLEDADFDKQSPFEAAPWFDNPPLIHWHLGSGMYSNASSYLSALRHRLAEHAQPNSFTSQKYGLIRYQPWVRYSQGLHDASNLTVSSKPTWFAHFKYHSGFKDKVKIEVRRGQHFNNATEYRRYADMLAEGKGKFGKQGASVKCESIGSIANIFTQNK